MTASSRSGTHIPVWAVFVIGMPRLRSLEPDESIADRYMRTVSRDHCEVKITRSLTRGHSGSVVASGVVMRQEIDCRSDSYDRCDGRKGGQLLATLKCSDARHHGDDSEKDEIGGRGDYQVASGEADGCPGKAIGAPRPTACGGHPL